MTAEEGVCRPVICRPVMGHVGMKGCPRSVTFCNRGTENQEEEGRIERRKDKRSADGLTDEWIDKWESLKKQEEGHRDACY